MLASPLDELAKIARSADRAFFTAFGEIRRRFYLSLSGSGLARKRCLAERFDQASYPFTRLGHTGFIIAFGDQ